MSKSTSKALKGKINNFACVEEKFIKKQRFKKLGLEALMELTMQSWDLVKTDVRENQTKRTKKRISVAESRRRDA